LSLRRGGYVDRTFATLFAVLALIALAPISGASPPEADRPVELPPFRVLADMLTINFRANSHGIVSRANVTQVTPNSPAAKRDIEVYDQLVAIDDIPVTGARYAKMDELIGRDLKPGTALKLSFLGRRGFFGQRRIKYDFVIMRRPLKYDYP
jgi:membrane-associated protease RseP (regulator of RpoE activity)